MSANAAKIKQFQLSFLKFLNEKNIEEVHIYYHVINYWSNDQSMVSLQELKDAITDLCNRNLIISKNNAHLSIGAQGVPEEDQKNNAVCTILGTGKQYIKAAELGKKMRNTFIILMLAAAIFFIWRYKIFSYVFR